MKKVIKFPKKFKYDKRVEQYCKIECPKCWIDKETGRAFCYGKWEFDDKYYYSDGNECDLTIDFCLVAKCDF